MRKSALAILFAIILGALFGAPAAHAEDEIAEKAKHPHVIDKANVFTPGEEDRLWKAFDNAYERYGLATVLETVPSIGGQNPKAVAEERANELGVGDAKRDNGLYLLYVAGDGSDGSRYYYMAPGSGVAKVVSQDKIQSVVDKIAIPQFKEKRYYEGVVRSVAQVAIAYNNGEGAPLPHEEAQKDLQDTLFTMLLLAGGVAVLLGVAVFMFLRFSPSGKARRRERLLAELADEVGRSTAKSGSGYERLRNGSARMEYLRPSFASVKDVTEAELVDAEAKVSERWLKSRTDTLWSTNGLRREYRPQVTVDNKAPLSSQLQAYQDKTDALLEKQAADRAESERIWSSLSEADRERIRQNPRGSFAQSILQTMNSNLPLALFVGYMVGSHFRPSSDSFRSSGPASDFSSFGGDSFGGGSFDGGGAGGSW